MKLFTIGLIAGTAFAEPNLRPTDRKLSGETIGIDHTLTLDGTAYVNLNTIAGVKVLAEAFKTQEENRLEQCTTDLLVTYGEEKIAYDSDLIAYNWATAKKAFLCQEWSAYEGCSTESTPDALVGQDAEADLASQTASSRRRLDITVEHLEISLNYLGSGMTTCPAEPETTKPSDCPASAPSTVNDPGAWDTANGDEPDYSGTLTPPTEPTPPAGCGIICDDARTDPQMFECSIRNQCIAEKVCGIKRVILQLDPNHTF
jgi:hypothetical protein